MDQVAKFIDGIVAQRAKTPANRAVLVGISGIDASGKGFITAKVAEHLRGGSINVAAICVDDWLKLPHHRFNPDNLAEHFYEHALRFEEMFAQLILPLGNNRRIKLDADHTDETASTHRKHRYEYRDVDVILLEGIFLLKRAYRHHFDLTAWVDCSFATGLKRAITRCQEGLSPAETIKAFTTIYFPAQRVHFARDNPQGAADFIIRNDNASRIHAKT